MSYKAHPKYKDKISVMTKTIDSNERIDAIQILRAVAALMVAYGHALAVTTKIAKPDNITFSWPSLPIGHGVDIFFVISGFIMVYVSEKLFTKHGGWQDFISKRLIRIIPLYWFATVIFLVLLVVDALRGGLFPNFEAIITSLLFIPSMAFKPDGSQPYPIVAGGWTLEHEMYFYVIFAFFIGLKREFAVAAVSFFIIAVCSLVLIFQPDSTLFQFWGRGINCEFIMGMLLALAWRKGVVLRPIIRVIICFAAFAWVSWSKFIPHADNSPYGFIRLWSWGVPAAMLVAAASLGKTVIPKTFEKMALLLGDASYSIYLVHPIVYVILQHSPIKFVALIGVWPTVALLFFTGATVSLAVYLWIERPMLGFIKQRLLATKTTIN